MVSHSPHHRADVRAEVPGARIRGARSRRARSRRAHVRGAVRLGNAVAAATVVAVAAVAVVAVDPSSTASAAAGASRRCAATSAPTHRVGDGDTWFDIAVDAGVSMASLLGANAAEADDVIHPGDVLCLPAGARAAQAGGACTSATHTVDDGESWFLIARRASVPMRDLLAANGASVDTVLQPGRRLCLPAGARLTPASVELRALPMHGPCWYGDTWGDARGNGRRHEGVDLIAEEGNHVYAVTDGVLTGRAWDQPGSLSGNAWWLTAADGTYFFYAHLSDFAPGLKVGSRVRAGQIIGFNGTTGSSATPHLHFEIHPGGGEAVNPYPIVRAAGGCKRGDGYEQPGGWIP